MTDEQWMLQAEINELRSELARHHRDFEAISLICALTFLELDELSKWPHTEIKQDGITREALRAIRKIVG